MLIVKYEKTIWYSRINKEELKLNGFYIFIFS